MSKDNSDFFEGKKEWSETKDALLGCYLKPYFQKILTTGRNTYFFDCFAGKGRFSDNQNGSPLIALQAANSAMSHRQLSSDNKIYAFFIEKKYHNELTNNLNTFSNYDERGYRVCKGDYRKVIQPLLDELTNENVFLYIDPFGVKSIPFHLFTQFSRLRSPSIEILLNLNSFGLFRLACSAFKIKKNDCVFDEYNDYDNVDKRSGDRNIAITDSIAGGTYWREIVEDYRDDKIDGYEAEEKLAYGYRQALSKYFDYVLDMPIRVQESHRPKYRMFHMCNHEEGCFLMGENMQKRNKELILRRYKDDTPLLPLDFGSGTINEMPTLTSKELEENLLSCLDENAKISITCLVAKYITRYGLIEDFNHLYDVLKKLNNKRAVRIDRCPSTTPQGKNSTFWLESKGKRVFITKE